MGQLEDLKEHNAFRVFKELSSRPSATRPELASATGLTRATVGLLIDYLSTRNLVRETGIGTSTGGRPPRLLEANPDAAYAMGAAMYDQQWTVVMANLSGSVVDEVTVRMRDSDPQSAVDAIKDGIEALRQRHNNIWILPKIGIGSPGLVDWHTGSVKSAVDVGWFDVPLAEMIEAATGYTSHVLNRSKLGALAEYWHDNRQTRDLVYISVGTGIAAGIIHKGELYIGPTSSAGELGHTTIEPDGPLCACGNRGCLQELVSERVLTSKARERVRSSFSGPLYDLAGDHPERLSVFDLFEASVSDDQVATDILDDAASYLGIAVANIVNLLNPEKIILGGPMACGSVLFCQKIEEQIRRRAMAVSVSSLKIEQSTLGPEAGAIGAAVLVLQDIADLIFMENSRSEDLIT